MVLTIMVVIAFSWLSIVAARLHAELQQDKETGESEFMKPSFTGRS
jgi:hypothetical protein